MKHRVYAMEAAYLAALLSDRRDILAAARAMGSAAEMRAARDDLMARAQIFFTPPEGEAVEYRIEGGVAHIPIQGQLTPSADPCGALTGNSETEYGYIIAALIDAEDNPEVNEIALDVNSPGGYMAGLDEAAQMIGAVTKPVTAYVSDMAASAAYYLASQADKIVAMSPASRVGSIGVALEEYDDDEALAADGIAHRVYTSSDAPDKRPDTKTEEGRAKIIAELDDLHAIFVRRVADGRGVSPETVNKDFGRGGLVIAEKALAVGMLDEVRGSHIIREGNTGVAGKAEEAKTNRGRVKSMTLDEYKAQAPEHAEALRDEGRMQERQRVAALDAWAGINADVDRIVAEAKASGKTYNDVASQLNAASARGKGAPAANGENPPAVNTSVPDTVSGASGFTAEDEKAAKMMGMTMQEYAKYSDMAAKGVK